MSAAFPLGKLRYLRLRIHLGMVALLAVLAAAGGCHHAAPPKANKIPEVVVTTPVTDEVTDYQDFTGRMDAMKTVDIRPRVSGYIDEAPFLEGDIVKEGEKLFQIDPRQYQDEVNQAKANLALAQADVALQRNRATRGRELMRGGSGAIGLEDYDQLIAAERKAVASVAAMKAALERAELNLEFTHVKVPPLGKFKDKPLIGRISRRMVDPGNIVTADQTILTTLVSIDPMYAYFDVDERTYLELRANVNSSESHSWFSTMQFPVLMRLANEDEFHAKGYVNFLDNRLNANTGTVRMRGVFDNPNDVLKAGLFARIRLPKGAPYNALMVPDEALLSDQGRKYVYVVKDIKKEENDKGEEVEKGKVEYRKVELGQALGGLRVIKEGLKQDEQVIVSGMQRVKDGAVVQVKKQPSRQPPESSLTTILKEDRATRPSDPKAAPAAPALKEMPRAPSGGGRHGGKGRR